MLNDLYLKSRKSKKQGSLSSRSRKGVGVVYFVSRASTPSGTSVATTAPLYFENKPINMKKIILKFMCLSFWMLTSLQTQAQTPFSLLWNFTGSTSGATASTPPAGLTVGNMTIGNTFGTVTAISSTSASSGYTGASGTNNIGNAAVTGALNTATSAYVQVVITPSAGDVFTFTGISLATRSTVAGPQAYAIRTSVDNYATTVASNTITNNSTWSFTSNTFTNPVASAAGTAITIRIYGYNGTGSAGSNTINWRLDDITITGTVGSATNPILGTNIAIPNFGNQCINTISTGTSLNIEGINLTNDPIIIGPNSNFKFSESVYGVYYDSLIINQFGGMFSDTIFVAFNPTTLGLISENINIIGGGAPQVFTTVSGTSLNSTILTTSLPISYSYNSAIIQGQVDSFNCGGLITNYGIEWGTTSSLTSGTTLTASTNMSSNTFTSTLIGLTANTTYYYRAYAVSTYGTSYSSILSFTTSLAPGSLLWNFTGSTTGATASTPPAGLTVGNMTIGNTLGTVTAISSTSASSGYTGASGTNNIGNAAVTGALNTATSAYVQVVITPSAGDVFTFTGISLATRSTVAGPQAYAIRTSVDNYATTVASNTITNNSTWSFTSNTFTNPVASAAGTAITIRIYGYNGTGSAGSNTINWRLDDITITGTVGSATNPTLGTSVTALNFGSKCINTTSLDSFTINGNNLSSASNVEVAALSGFQYSTSLNGTFANNLSLTQAGGSYSQKVYVQYQPTVAIAYNGAVSISGGGVSSPISLNITASGISTPPSVSAQAASSITINDVVLNASGVAAGCGSVSNYYFEYSTIQNFTAGTGTVATGNNLNNGEFSVALSNLNSSTTYYYKAFVTNSNGITTPSAEMSFTTLSSSPTLNIGTLSSFGNQCINALSAGSALTISGINLLTNPIQVGPTADFKFSETLNGTYLDSLVLTQSGGTYNQTIYVAFIPSTVGSVNNTIQINGGGTSTTAIVSGTGINTLPVVDANNPISISYNGAILSATISALNCGTISAYGFECSTDANLANAATLSSSNLIAGSFSADLLNLSANTVYYFRSYLVASNGTVYSAITSFQTAQIPAPTGLTATNVTANSFVANWNQVVSVANYRLDVSTSSNFWGTPIALLGFNFNAQTNIPTSGISSNASQTLSTVGANAPTFNAGGNGGFTARADGWNSGNGTKYWQTSFATTGYGNITVSSKQRSSNSGPKNFKLQYRVGSTGNFSDVPNATIVAADDYITGVLNNVVLPSECNDKPLVFVRWIMTSNTSVSNSTVTTTGTSNIDDILINGAEASFLPNYNNKLVTSLSDTVTGLNSNTIYYYRLRTMINNDVSVNSITQNVQTSCETPIFYGVVTNASCNGNNGGSIALTIPNGANYTYSWTGVNGFNASTKDINVNTIGVYYVNVSNGACSTSDSFIVSAPPQLFVTAITTLDTICAGQSVTLNGTGATTYTWNNGVTNGVSFVPTATQTYTVTGTNTTTGCSNTANVTVTVNALPNVGAGSNQTICVGQSVTLNGTGATTYTWNNGVSNGVSFVPTATQTYTVTGTNTTTGCSNTANVTVTVNALPNVGAGSNQTICVGQSVTLNGTGATTYTWNNGVSNGVSFVPTATQTYTVTGTNTTTGCSNSANVTIQVNPIPTLNAGIDTSVCLGNPIILQALSNGLVSWSNGVVNNQPFVPSTSNSYVATVIDSNGCSNKDTVTVTVNPNPIATTSTTQTAICPNGSTSLTATGGATYLWSNGDTSATTTVNQAGNYYVVATNQFGCSDTSNTVSIIQKAMPTTVKVKYDGPSTVCEPNTVNYILDMPLGSTTGFAYQWYLAGTSIPGATDSVYQANNSGLYSVSVIGGNSCVKTSAGKPSIVNTKPIAAFTANGPTTICSGNLVTFSAPSILGYSYIWLKDGVAAGSGITKTFKLAGNYTVVAKLNGCTDTASPIIPIVVNPLPLAAISALSPATFCAGDSCTLSATPIGMTNYKWYSGNNLLASTNNATQKVGIAGTMKVMVTDPNACVSKVSSTNVKTKVSPIPVATISVSGTNQLSATGFVKLKASPTTADAYQWYKDGQILTGATNNIYITSVGGNFTANVTKLGCTGVSNTITIASVSPKEQQEIVQYLDEQFELAAYPNPVTNLLTINVRGIEEVNATIQVMDFSGRLVAMKAMTTSSTTVDMTGYASGVYLIRYKDAEGRTGTIKITKE